MLKFIPKKLLSCLLATSLLLALPLTAVAAQSPGKSNQIGKLKKSKLTTSYVKNFLNSKKQSNPSIGKPDSPINSVDPIKDKYAPGRIIVKFKSSTQKTQEDSLKASYKLEKLKDLGTTKVQLLKIKDGTDPLAVASSLTKSGLVEYAEPDYVVRTAAFSNDPRDGELWGLNNTGQTIEGQAGVANVDVDVPEAWAVSEGTNNVVVAVIDTGIDTNHDELKDRIWTNTGEIPGNGIDDDGNGYVDDVNGWDFYNGDNTVTDDHGHGTHVSGTITAKKDNAIGVAGIAPKVKIMALKFLNSGGSGYTSDAILAVNYAANKGVKISNNSWSGGSYSSALEDAISNSGMLFVAAAGNYGDNNDYYPQYPASYTCPNIISVAAVDNQGNMPWWSNYGFTSVDVGAPGVNILSSLPGNTYAYWSGTSMATPHVVGTAALYLSVNSGTTIDKLKQQVITTGKKLDSLYGYTATGLLVSAHKALTSDGNDDIPGVDADAPGKITSSVNADTDIDDVYAVTLKSGESISAKLTGPTGTDFDLYLYSKDAQTVKTGEGILAYSEGSTSTESLTYKVSEDGEYFVNVSAYSGSGDYDLILNWGNGEGYYENTNSSIDYISSYYYNNFWTQVDNSNHSGGSIKQTTADASTKYNGTYFTMDFIGQQIDWLAYKGPSQGIADVYIDGDKVTSVSLYSTTDQYKQKVFTSDVLPYERHTISVKWTGKFDPNAKKTAKAINLDALSVTGKIVVDGTYEDVDTSISYTGSWILSKSSSYGGGSMSYSNTANASATLAFYGTKVQWVATKSPSYGIAKVYIDGNLVSTIDLYNSTWQPKQTVFSKTGLDEKVHKIKIVRTGTKNPSATNALLSVDQIKVSSNKAGTYENNNANLTYKQTWTTISNPTLYSGGSLAYSNSTGAEVSLTFRGTGVKWMALKSSDYGYSRVFLDNVQVTNKDLYSATPLGKQIVYTKTGLSSGLHTIKILRINYKNPSSSGYKTNIDALIVN